ncbi:MAG: hypothetical protein KBB01_03720 [Candidatus Omnitrophica bacterium]|jgi:hypothetical protein|nr:hypothetical protein [Candidatus Omnitrophota bacterium]
MVNFKERVFLVCGANFFHRQQTIDNIKKRLLDKETAAINTFTFYNEEIKVEDLKILITPSFNHKKLIIFKDFLHLAVDLKKFILDHFDKILSDTYLVFETEEDYYSLRNNARLISDPFFKTVFDKAAILKIFSNRRNNSIEDFKKSVKRNNFIASLDIIENLIDSGAKDKDLGPQIIGILTSHFSYLTDSPQRNKYFQYLWEADRSLKELGVNPRLVIEMLLVKLSKLGTAIS